MDIDLFGNIFIVADVFRRVTTDLLLNEPVPLSTGLISNPRRNVGDITNEGIELTINYKKQVGAVFLDISANGTYLRNNVDRLGAANDPIFAANVTRSLPNDLSLGFVTRTEVGQPIGTFYGRVVERIYTQEDFVNGELLSSLPQPLGYTPTPGDFKFADINNDGEIDNEDRTFIGSPIPKYNFGFVLNASYKNWDLSTAFQGVADVSVFNVLRYHTHGFNGSNALSGLSTEAYRNNLNLEGSGLPQDITEQYSGTNENVIYPIFKNGANDQSYRFASDFYVEDASYVRLKNVTLGYNFPDETLKILRLTSLKLYVTGQNLLTFTNYEGFDPEINNNNALQSGIDYGSYPQARLYLVGLNATF